MYHVADYQAALVHYKNHLLMCKSLLGSNRIKGGEAEAKNSIVRTEKALKIDTQQHHILKNIKTEPEDVQIQQYGWLGDTFFVV